MTKKILVTGGAGYIGSHTIVDLIDNGFEVVSIDNFLNATKEIFDGIKKITGKKVKNYDVDLCDYKKLKKVFKKHKFEGIIHFAALKSVGESVEMPLEYYTNNVLGLSNILKAAKKYEVKNFIFSSSCSVYGNPTKLPVTEKTPLKKAESPYAFTKVIGERVVEDFIVANTDYKAVLLRYFNPAGAHPSNEIGESSPKMLNLVPVITAVGAGKKEKLTVFGNDYETRDGSCVRDYIHVCDLANAHTLALQKSIENTLDTLDIINLGSGDGVTVLEAINAFEKISGQKLNYSIEGRRAGDVVAVYADNEKAKTVLGWNPKYNIEDIMTTAWNWEKAPSKSSPEGKTS
jgi:UDP-glucose 4-epimerase